MGAVEAAEAQARDQRGGLPMAMRNRGATSLAAGLRPRQPGHLGGGPGLVDEDELRRVELGLEIEPGLAACG